MNEGKRVKSHQNKKNYRGHEAYRDRNRARNLARPKQRFLGLDGTGKGLGWVRE